MISEQPWPAMRYPLLASGGTSVARRGGIAISRARFLQDVAALAEILPRADHVINLCGDRYRFMVGFAAAMCRGQVSLLPPFDTQTIWAQLAADYPGVMVLHDSEAPMCDLPLLPYPSQLDVADEPAEREIPSFADGQVAVVLFTSGSTGRPQPHARNWGMLVRSALAAGEALGISAWPGAAVIGTVPHQHSYGLESLVMLSLQHGLVLHAERPFYPADIRARLAEAANKRILVTTPVHLRVLLEDDAVLPRVDLVLSATAPLSVPLARRAEARFSGGVQEIYGCSEAGQLAARRTVQTEEWCCLEGVALVRRGTEIWTDTVLGQAPVAVRTRLGDIVELCDERRFILLGRADDMVNIAGKRTSLGSLTFHLNAIEGVKDGVFLLTESAPDEPVRRLMAFVVAPEMSEATVLAALRLRIDAAFLPRPLHLVKALPRNGVGKVMASTIRDLLTQAGEN